MPKFSYFCKACEEAYEVRMSMEEQEGLIPRCPSCYDEEKQELYAVSDGARSGCGGHCGNAHGCC
ncbi:MAG: hypothetical protein FWF95_06585 [Syntrophorhabdaceae bacterium]|nr:hypothetical protein [Syntrophorhabdaceae bacterium]